MRIRLFLMLCVGLSIGLSACVTTEVRTVTTVGDEQKEALQPTPEVPLRDTVHHELMVRLEPATGALYVSDRITLPAQMLDRASDAPDGNHVRQVEFQLAPGMGLTRALPGVDPIMPNIGVYEVRVTDNNPTVLMEYTGSLPATQSPPGTVDAITPGLALLSGNSFWYPRFVRPYSRMNEWLPEFFSETFNLTVLVPKGWHVVSQGKGPLPPPEWLAVPDDARALRWEADQPQDEIYLVAAPFTFYELPGGVAPAQAFLLEPDLELADRYMTATARYLSVYEKLLGPYPYEKFAVVENRSETGWGMPSFTLLGSQVMRLPFIPHTSLPHEIVHNWWGNGVYVKPRRGNWAEGLTNYVADHLLKERDGKGAEYRRDMLQKYTDFVRGGEDFPLADFRARDGEASQAVGYGKSMMLFHMLRIRMGDGDFKQALQNLYAEFRFKQAGWDDLEMVFSRTSGLELAPVFDQWLTRTGAPTLSVTDARAVKKGSGYELNATLWQTGTPAPYILYVPVAVTLEGEPTARKSLVKMTGASRNFDLMFPTRPVHLAIDPEYDVFRRLAAAETPPALSGLFGADQAIFVLPASAREEARTAYRALAEAWAGQYKTARMITDAELSRLPEAKTAAGALSALPAGAAVWVLGWENKLSADVIRAAPERLFVSLDGGLVLPEGSYPKENNAVVLAVRTGKGKKMAPVAWIAADTPAAIPGLARKLPHYSKYGYLVFGGTGPDNVLKGQWSATTSPLSVPVAFKGELPDAAPAPLPPRPNLLP